MAVEVCVLPTGWSGLIEEGSAFWEGGDGISRLFGPHGHIWVWHSTERYAVSREHISWARDLPDIAAPKRPVSNTGTKRDP